MTKNMDMKVPQPNGNEKAVVYNRITVAIPAKEKEPSNAPTSDSSKHNNHLTNTIIPAPHKTVKTLNEKGE